MILVDTSVWIDHLRQGDAELADALQQGRVAIHPFVVGEYVSIKDEDGDMHTFQVATVTTP